MPRVEVKPGADMRGLHPKIQDALLTVAWVYGKLDLKLTFTSGIDGDHSTGSLHYTGRAVDLRTRHVSQQIKLKIADMLRVELGWGYEVVVESTHIHIEWDPK